MSVNPDFGEQSFIENTYDKIRKLKAMIDTKETQAIIEINGGVNNKNTKALTEAEALVRNSNMF